MRDQYGRKIEYLRVSITDRCNLRCRYCMPDGVELVEMKDILTYEEILSVCREAAALGIRKIKVTGGEPLVRKGCPELISDLKALEGIDQVTLTTNGVLLEKMLPALLSAGLDAVNVSLDTLRRDRYAVITGRDGLEQTLSGIRAALSTPLRLKVNAVLQQGVNDDEWLDIASLARDNRLDVRFIEMMPIGYGREIAGVSNEQLRAALQERYPGMAEDVSLHGNGPARYVSLPGWQGSVGFISAIHGKFCADCNRIRLTAQGKLKPCLCFGETTDLRPLLRSEHPDPKALRAALEKAIWSKPKQHCFEEPEKITETARMASIGG